MKLEFLDDLTEGGEFTDIPCEQLVRLYDFDRTEVVRLRDLIRKEIIENKQSVQLSELEFIESVNCTVTLNLNEEDLGMETVDNTHFECGLTLASYHKILYLLEAFCGKKCSGFQWLYEADNPVEFLFSQNGDW